MENQKKSIKVTCPTCKKEAIWKNNQYRPFCSERCKLIDLGNWADESYNIEGNTPPDFEKEM